jgi:hypothetical protein
MATIYTSDHVFLVIFTKNVRIYSLRPTVNNFSQEFRQMTISKRAETVKQQNTRTTKKNIPAIAQS